MTIYTGASTSLMYGYETVFGTAPSGITNTFGLNQKVTTLSLNTSRFQLNKLGQVEPTKYGYGQQSGSVGIGFVLDDSHSHKIFKSIYGTASGNAPFKYPANLGQGNAPTGVTGNSITTQIQLQAGSDKLTRTLNGCIVQSLSLSTSIGEPVNASCDMSFGKETTAAVKTASSTITEQTSTSPAVDQGGSPYTFAHGLVKVHNGSSLVEVAEVQEFDINFSQNAELLYGLNSHTAVDAYRRVFDISGRFRAAFKDERMIQYVIDQSRSGTELLTAAVGIELTFVQGNKSIKIELNELSVADHGTSGIEPAEPIFEEINWSCKSARIEVDTSA
tara:strand:- start:1341 stop:2336 length:996 start_codon:yes stop_codon:yes gene_type:complete